MREDRSAASSQSGARTWHRWHFARTTLDERTLELLVDGVEVELERKPLAMLIYLLRHAGEVCTKDELLEGVWSGRVLSETVLTKCIGRLREVLKDRDQEIIKTAYGFGYRFVAPVRVEQVHVAEASHFDFSPGQQVPGRPNWSLVERLGAGGHGEAWRGKHDKTNEQRVFKFALDESSLGALKREITLFRVINDSLGDAARVVRLVDWNLEQPPYFLEAEFIEHGSLGDWMRARGGIAAVPLAERLEVLAAIAEALAAVHSVGVLHKDLKPSNVLVGSEPGGAPQFLLADFGSGGVLDPSFLERLGITRLGFTRTLTLVGPGSVSGTPAYLAPEVLASQAFTVKADIYSLGVMLYQLVVGDFSRPLSAGWERDVEDELLREDIALCAEGNPLRRLADAEQVARRLRSLPERREQLNRDREAAARAEMASRMLERVKARRVGLFIAFAALALGLATSTALFLRAREANRQSELTAAHAEAVTQFLSDDVLAPVSGDQSVKSLRIGELLERAGDQIDTRFAGQPAVAAKLHFVIGNSLNQFYDTSGAVKHFNRALALGRTLKGEGSVSAIRAAAELVYLDNAVGRLDDTLPTYEATLAAGMRELPADDRAVLRLRIEVARGHDLRGDWQLAATQFETLRKDFDSLNVTDPLLRGMASQYSGRVAVSLGDVAAAQVHLREAIRLLTLAYDEKHQQVSESRIALGRALTESNQFADAQATLDLAEEFVQAWEPMFTWTVARCWYSEALLLIDTGQIARARALLSDIVKYQDAENGERPELDHTGSVRQALAETWLREGQPLRAIEILRKAVAISDLADGAEHPQSRSIRLSLAEALLAVRRTSEARELIANEGEEIAGLPATHAYVAQLQRVRGLIALQSGDLAAARAHFAKSLRLYEALRGTAYWRAARVRQDLLAAG